MSEPSTAGSHGEAPAHLRKDDLLLCKQNHLLWESSFKGSRKASEQGSSLGSILALSFWSTNNPLSATLPASVPGLGAGVWWSCVTIEGELHSIIDRWAHRGAALTRAWGWEWSGVECGDMGKTRKTLLGHS